MWIEVALVVLLVLTVALSPFLLLFFLNVVSKKTIRQMVRSALTAGATPKGKQ